MNQQFQNIRNNGDKAQLQDFVQNSNAEELTKIVRHSICKTDSLEIFDDILQSFSDTEACQLKRHKLVKSTLKLLGKAKVPARDVDAIINRIIFDIPKYSKQYLVKLVDFCVVSICDNDDELQSWKDLLPVLLEALENEKYITHEDAEVSGAEYKSLTIKRICDYRWNTDLLPSLAKMFGDMALDKNDHKEVLRTLCRALSDLSLDQVPPFVYQALKLCKVQDKQHLLDTLCKYFDNCYSKAIALEDKDSIEDIGLVSTKEVRDVESTVLYHVYQAALLNHENMKDFLRYFKSVSHAPEYTLKPFVFAVLLSVSSIHEDQIFEILRLAIINSSLNKERRKSNAWLRQLLPSSCNIIEIIRQLVDSSNKDRHLVLKGLTDLAFMLMSTDQKVKNNATVVWSVGSEIVREVMKKRHETVVIVLQELVHKIVGGGISTTHYTDCLKYVCRELSVIVLDHQIWITTLLEQLLLLPTVVATQILYAIFPLMHVSPNIRVSLLLILRKALYRKGISKRQMAVTGFLEMLKYSKMHSLGSFRLSQRCNPNSYAISSSSRSTLTQATLEYNTQKSNTDCDKTLCYEILDILKKSFTYEFEVRLHLYEGFYASVTKNPEITEIVLDMLLSHLNLYFDTDDNTLPPIKFEMCTSVHGVEVVLQEPIGELIFVVQKIYVDIFLKKSKTFDKLHTVLESLCTRMAATELEHLNLEHGLDFSDDFMKSQAKLKSLGIAVTIYEALMAFRIGECVKGNQGSYGKINDLFNGYMRLADFVKLQSTKTKKFDGNKSKKDKDASNTTKKHGKSNNIKMPSTIMDLDTIHQALILLYSRPSSTQNDVNLRENSNFCRYIFQTCEQILQRTKSLMADTSQTQPNQYIDTYIEIGGLFHEYFLLVLTDALADDEQLAILALQCFKEICSCICTTASSSEFSRFLDRILRSKKDSVPRDVNSQLQEVVSSLDNYLIALIDEEIDSDTKNKVLLLLLQILEQFISKIDFEKCNLEKVHKCFSKMVRTENLASSITPAIIQFLLRLEEYTQEYGETLNEICLKLCEKVGTIDGSEISMDGEYQIIREDTFKQIYNVLNDYIKEKLNNVSWLLLRLKAEDTISRAPGTIDEVWNDNLREKERNLCKQLSHLIHVLHILSNTAIDLGPCTDVTFKNLQCLYHLLGNLTKYFYAKSSNQNAAFQTAKFIQVVQLAGKPLKSAFYNLVTYVEENQNKLNSKSDSHARRNKILKETKVIPRVVYEIEQFNKEVLLLGKRTGIPLENYMKHSVTRDFRIKNSQLVESLEKMDTSMLTLLNSEDAENETHSSNCEELNSSTDQASPSRKRSRMED